jgi:hypothetical protein
MDLFNYIIGQGTDACNTAVDPVVGADFSLPSARIYLQYYCTQDDKAVTRKKQAGLVVAGLGILICLMFLIGLSYLRTESNLDFTIWDFNTVTAGDFTIELKISDVQWETYLDIHQLDEEHDRRS